MCNTDAFKKAGFSKLSLGRKVNFQPYLKYVCVLFFFLFTRVVTSVKSHVKLEIFILMQNRFHW